MMVFGRLGGRVPVGLGEAPIASLVGFDENDMSLKGEMTQCDREGEEEEGSGKEAWRIESYVCHGRW